MNGAPIWIDLMTTDPAKSQAFYGALFGWTTVDPGPEYGGYINFLKDGEMVAGSMQNPGCGMLDAWSVYLQTDDAKSTLAAAVANGSEVIVDAMDVMALGTMAVVTDPGGAVIGMWQPGEHKGFGVTNVDGAPAWFELHTASYDKAVQFYKEVFKWDAHAAADSPELRYTTLGVDDAAVAGMMDASSYLPAGVPGKWEVYFKVDDTDATLDEITKLGGTVTEPAQDTPYGRLAAANDPTGARFKLMGPTKG